ncbi:MAG: magnesium-translocating P-type ATPase [Verrucomicrobia bacterium]|nr:MAG: magnesium-translocating P-type ATPase [Verrucomicrobiota bacterium]
MTSELLSAAATKGEKNHKSKSKLNKLLREVAQGDVNHAVRLMQSRRAGLTNAEAAERLKVFGKNEVAHEKPPLWYIQLAKAFYNPFILVLALLALVSLYTDIYTPLRTIRDSMPDAQKIVARIDEKGSAALGDAIYETLDYPARTAKFTSEVEKILKLSEGQPVAERSKKLYKMLRSADSDPKLAEVGEAIRTSKPNPASLEAGLTSTQATEEGINNGKSILNKLVAVLNAQPRDYHEAAKNLISEILRVQLSEQIQSVSDALAKAPQEKRAEIVAATLNDADADWRTVIVMTTMIVVSALLRFWQEFRSTKAAEKLKAMVRTTATVIRKTDDKEEGNDATLISAMGSSPGKMEIVMADLVPGDIIQLSAGDMIPADVRLLQTKDLFVSQSALTGESMPVEKIDNLAAVVEKKADAVVTSISDPLSIDTLCFLGTNVVSGSATAVVVATGEQSMFGSLAKSVLGHRAMTSFDKGVNKISWVLIKFMLAMVPIIFLINGALKEDWKEAFLFGVAVAVGLTPEMLPLVVTANLAKGAVAMSRRKVIVKRLNSMQNFGAMDVLCTDKTGTLTEDKVVLVRHLDVENRESESVVGLAYLNSFHQTGLKNLIDAAVIARMEERFPEMAQRQRGFRKVDEIPFDFVRRRMTVIVQKNTGHQLMVCKGAVEEIFSICTQVEKNGEFVPLEPATRTKVRELVSALNRDGLRVIGVAYRILPNKSEHYTIADESDMVLAGYIGFLDPPKPSAQAAIDALHNSGVAVKILTGDNEIVTAKVCREVGLDYQRIVLGSETENFSDTELADVAENTVVFAKMNPMQKARVIRALQSKKHTVGYMGDGINDAAALRDADVGISVDTAVDIAKESADIILLEKSLMVLEEGVLQGRAVFGNIIKYIKMTASSNFGNVFSVLIASAFIPFMPMLPIMLLILNLLYDFSQLFLPWDRMDKEFLTQPRKWQAGGLARFMILIGPISSIFDVTTFLLLWFVYHANSAAHQAFFQSGWFIESLLSQTLIVHMIRTQKIPFIQSTASATVLISTTVIMAVGTVIPFTAFGTSVGMVPLPASFFPWLAVTLLGYCALTQVLKTAYIKRFGDWL